MVRSANVFLFTGQQYTTSATAAILISLSPILSVGLATVVLPSNSLTRRSVFGVVLGLIGAGIVATPIGYVAYFSLLEAVGPVRVNLLTYVSPLVTALLG